MTLSRAAKPLLRACLLFRFLLGIAAVVALVLLYFFVISLADGSVSSFNILLWLALLGHGSRAGRRLDAEREGATWRRQRHSGSLGHSGLLFGLFFLLLIVLQPNWH